MRSMWIHLKDAGKVVHEDIVKVFQDDNFFCVVTKLGNVQKLTRYPISNIFKIEEWSDEDRGVITTTPAPIQPVYIYMPPLKWNEVFPYIKDGDEVKIGDGMPNRYPVTVSTYQTNTHGDGTHTNGG